MALVPTKVEEQHADAAEYDERPRIYLSDDIVEKLGLKGVPQAGAMFMMRAAVVAESVTSRAEEAEEVAVEGTAPDVSMCLILTAVELTPAKASAEETAKALYGGE